MSQRGDTPQPGRADPFFAAYGRPPITLEERAEFEVFWAQCQADWQVEIAEGLGQFAPYEALEDVDTEPFTTAPFRAAPVGADPVGTAIYRREMPDGPPLPAGLDLTEVFAAVPPEHRFDDDLREEFLYAEYLRTTHDTNDEPHHSAPATDDPSADDQTCTDRTCTDRSGADQSGTDRSGADQLDPLEGLNPFQRRQAQFVDRVLYFEKLIGWAQASKAEVLTEAWDYTTNTAETGRPQAGPQHEHDWAATFAAQQGLVAEIACALRIPGGTASGLLQQSRVLVAERPDTLTALRTGDISLRHVRQVLDQLSSVPQPARTDLETVLLPHAKRLTPAQFDGKARKLRERFHPDSITVRRARCLADRGVQFFPDKDGMATLWLRAAGDDLQAVYTRVTDAAISLQGPDEPRTLSQLRADVAVDLLQQGVTGSGLGAGLTANVNITVPVLTLMGKSEEPGELEGYGPIDPETARKLAGTATSFLRVLTHPHTGIVLDVSAEPFRVPAALKKYLRLRDGSCRFPGCNRSAGHSDLDHTIDKQFGGPTTATNLHFLSPAHHNLKHFSNWTVTADPDGTLHWTSPAGKHYATDPATRITPPPQQAPPTPPPPATPPPPVPDPWTSDRAASGSDTTDTDTHPF
ncbi:HNH endonuclease [Cryobacterium sp. TMT1-3]|uniref:HNH endonuclease signature motif containing protein n=1 Tax=Cryobacterium sp. TMT1-3 TaxID=1259237 RepID=UPI00106B1AFB|nr:HNH endonuclease signature motif containing protein [Cryobacterium sp. TMT1-3]TFC25077.1 HNH endonuclease [Cryobacterium sp. TMT1-3]